MKTYFYHSPYIKGEKRHTLSGIIDNGVLTLGLASCSLQDVFNKQKGRELSENRAGSTTRNSGSVVLGKNKHTGVIFRKMAMALTISMSSDSVDVTHYHQKNKGVDGL
jgi:hypothetical protein